MRVAFVGAGQIGAPMSERLLAAGHDVTVYARRAEVREHFAAAGAAVTDSWPTRRAAPRSSTSRVYSDEQLEEVTLGDDGLVAQPRRRHAPRVAHHRQPRRRSRRIAAAGNGHVVDAPFSGGSDDVLAGTLTVMLGGAPDDVARARDDRRRVRRSDASTSARSAARSS